MARFSSSFVVTSVVGSYKILVSYGSALRIFISREFKIQTPRTLDRNEKANYQSCEQLPSPTAFATAN
jgi:hypothetical protein